MHVESEDHAWTVNLADHPARTESPAFRRAKTAAKKIMAGLPLWLFGPGPYQMHHGGSIWVNVDGTDSGWRLVLGLAGIEWSMQFVADPAKVDGLRTAAKELVDAFPHTRPALHAFGYTDVDILLDTPILGPAGISTWTDGLFNSCVPIPATWHTGVLPNGAGYHHYPKPIVDAEFFKRDTWQLWHDGVAVVPTEVADGTVEVVHVPDGHPMRPAHVLEHAAGRRHFLPADHPIARAAHAEETP